MDAQVFTLGLSSLSWREITKLPECPPSQFCSFRSERHLLVDLFTGRRTVAMSVALREIVAFHVCIEEFSIVPYPAWSRRRSSDVGLVELRGC